MTREEEIRQAATKIAKEWYCGPEDEFHYEVEKLEEMGQWVDEHPKNPWISVADRLPEKLNKFFSDFVLVMYTRGCKHCPFITRYDYECGMWEIENVTHWMPIPELLKGGEE